MVLVFMWSAISFNSTQFLHWALLLGPLICKPSTNSLYSSSLQGFLTCLGRSLLCTWGFVLPRMSSALYTPHPRNAYKQWVLKWKLRVEVLQVFLRHKFSLLSQHEPAVGLQVSRTGQIHNVLMESFQHPIMSAYHHLLHTVFSLIFV